MEFNWGNCYFTYSKSQAPIIACRSYRSLLNLYGLGRFFIEGMRTDSLYIGPFVFHKLFLFYSFYFGVALIIYQRFYVYPKTSILYGWDEL